MQPEWTGRVSAQVWVFPVDPVAKPRMTRRDKWAKREVVVAYRAFCDALNAHAARLRFVPPLCGAHITFHIAMPESWSGKKRLRMDGTPHQQKPDKDNLEKAFWDALLPDDSKVWHTGEVKKVWASWGRIEVTVHAYEGTVEGAPEGRAAA